MNLWLAGKLYMFLQFMRKEPVAKALQDVRRTEFVSRDELFQIQAGRQLEQIRFAQRFIPFYQDVYSGFKDQVHNAKIWDDVNVLMESLPVVERDTITKDPKKFIASNIQELKTYPDKTSGSSGTPLIFPCDQRAWAYRHALTFRNKESFGIQIGEPYAYIFGLHWNKKMRAQVRLRDWIFNRVRISAFEISPAKLEDHFKSLQHHHPTHIIGYPSAIYELCVMARDKGYEHLRELNLKAIFTTAEPLRTYQRELINMVTGSRCVDTYGSAEGGLTAVECPHGSLHVQSEAVWVQMRDPSQSQGDILVTDLMLRAFPMIRYAIGDESAWQTGSCSCGRAHPVIEPVAGRTGDSILLSNGKRINGNLPSYIFKPLSQYGVIRRYRFVQEMGQALKLYLVTTPGFSEQHLEIIKQETQRAFGNDLSFTVTLVDDLPHLPNAKHRDFVVVN